MREQLPNRRRSELRSFEHRGRTYTLSASYFPGTREPARILLSNSKPGSESEAIARDSAILVSLCLQFGVDLSILRHAVETVTDAVVNSLKEAIRIVETGELSATRNPRRRTNLRVAIAGTARVFHTGNGV